MTFSAGPDPLAYTGINPQQQPPLLRADRPPTSNDIRDPGTYWLDRSANPDVLYITPGEGIWVNLSTTGAGVQTINSILPDGLGEYGIVAGAGITITPGVNQITIAATAGALSITPDVGVAVTNFIYSSTAIQVMAAGIPIQTRGTAASLVVEVQRSSAAAAFDLTLNGLSHYDSQSFTVSTEGFVTLNGNSVLTVVTPTLAPYQADFAAIPLADDTGYFIRAEIIGFEAAPGAGTICSGSLEVVAHRTGGGTAVIDIPQNLFKISAPQPQPAPPALDFNFVESGNNLILRVFGTTVAMNWKAKITIVQTP